VFFSNISGFEGIFLFNYLVRSWWIFVGVIREVSLELKAGETPDLASSLIRLAFGLLQCLWPLFQDWSGTLPLDLILVLSLQAGAKNGAGFYGLEPVKK
jgi:hypothetical protein